MPYQPAYEPIENYGIIGNMRTAALVGMNGSIDWYCYPHFDSPSIFGAILDDNQGGRCQICPMDDQVRHNQFYWPSTNILITRFLLPEGIAELEDFMPVGLPSDSPWYQHLYRRIRCVRGAVRISLMCRPAFDYGRKNDEVLVDDQGAVFRSGRMSIALSAAVPLTQDGKGGVAAEFTLEEGKSQVFILRDHGATEMVPCSPTESEAEELFQNTVKFWHKWLSACTYQGRWREQVYRSALALKLLTFHPTGAIIAAPTTSLPEVIGGTRNWDYRYTWARDAAFTVYAFLRIGFRAEAAGFINWLEKNTAKQHRPDAPLPVLSSIRGDTRISEQILEHWEGYRGSGPVRIGNAAVSQFQLDVYGEIMDALYLFNKYVSPIAYHGWLTNRQLLEWICSHWPLPYVVPWEQRNREA